MENGVTFVGVDSIQGGLKFEFGEGKSFRVIELLEGIMTIALEDEMTEELAKNIARCFKIGSSFSGLQDVIILNSTNSFSYKIKAVGTQTQDTIFRFIQDGEKQRRKEEYIKRAEKKVIEVILFIGDLKQGRWNVEEEEIKFKDVGAKERFEKYAQEHQDDWSKIIISYTQEWAKIMQIALRNNLEISHIAEETSKIPENNEVILNDPHFFNTVINLLCECWRYGNEIGEWYIMTREH